MGAVRIDIGNRQLDNLADYSDRRRLKKLYKNIDNIKSLAQEGDTCAAFIYIDLMTAISPEKGVITEVQRRCMIGYFFRRYTLQELSVEYKCDASTISDNINAGIKRIQKALNDGSLYRRSDN